jgi:hypothetical protein
MTDNPEIIQGKDCRRLANFARTFLGLRVPSRFCSNYPL